LQALGANPVPMDWFDAQVAFYHGTVDGQENPLALIIPYQLWAVHRYDQPIDPRGQWQDLG
jgi:TRAP-type C4-dicarboxylate transport system substrate-binding protein